MPRATLGFIVAPIALASLVSSFASSGCSSSKEHEAPTPRPARMLATATAKLESRSDSKVTGTVTFSEREMSHGDETMIVVDVRYDITGITPGETRGFHVHEVGDCSAPDAASAGPHFNPGSHEHGPMEHPMSHAGDLGNVTANPAGRAEGLITGLTKLSLTSGAAGNIVGRAVVVHAQADDLTSQPAGNAGARVACGVIVAD